jgi:anionic cell wall polymer biosynthesis LytR-Cps2A-Psr (LCP) family protein
MDRPTGQARTDNIVIVDPARERLLWIPRDLWHPASRERINAAFAHGGHEAFLGGLLQSGLHADYSVCVGRASVERALSDVEVTVPVSRPLAFWYPLEPRRPIEEGRKLVRFDPPAEVLSGERIHQWIGARYAVDRSADDFDRMARQQILLRCLLRDGFDFGCFLTDPAALSVSDEEALGEVAKVRETWRFETLRDVKAKTIDGKAVLVRRRQLLRRRGLT